MSLFQTKQSNPVKYMFLPAKTFVYLNITPVYEATELNFFFRGIHRLPSCLIIIRNFSQLDRTTEQTEYCHFNTFTAGVKLPEFYFI